MGVCLVCVSAAAWRHIHLSKLYHSMFQAASQHITDTLDHAGCKLGIQRSSQLQIVVGTGMSLVPLLVCKDEAPQVTERNPNNIDAQWSYDTTDFHCTSDHPGQKLLLTSPNSNQPKETGAVSFDITDHGRWHMCIGEAVTRVFTALIALTTTELPLPLGDSTGNWGYQQSPARVVPFQPPSRRPTRLTVPGPGVRRMSGIHVVETPSSTSSPCECPSSEIGAEQAAPTAEASAGASRDLWEKLLAGSGLSGPSGRGPGGPGPGNPRAETVHQPAEDQGRSTSRQLPSAAAAAFDQVSSSSPTLGSANLSDILRSTSAFADHASGSSSHGSQTPTPRVEEDAGQVARAQSSSGSSSGGERQPRLDQRQALEALAQDVAAEPVCAFSTNVSEAEEFGSGDDLDLPM
ncbi:pgl [Symbiodinium necroappetens]|uniref:Pgl protein n=1 Tax=Symbiodinium necroappetens TaxID=1628268 RepID=A0A813C046_9DINO|nr:pgl [Symbiodinium necroappetens]